MKYKNDISEQYTKFNLKVFITDLVGKMEILSADNINFVNLTAIQAHNEFYYNNSTQAGWINSIIQLGNGLIATAADDGKIKLWKSLPNQPYIELVRTLSSSFYQYSLIDVSENVLITGACQGTVLLWDINTGALLMTLNVTLNPERNCVNSFLMMPDERLAIAYDFNRTFTYITLLNLTDFTFEHIISVQASVASMTLTRYGTALSAGTLSGALHHLTEVPFGCILLQIGPD